MAFKPRLTRPEKGNKYYIRKDSGGYSTAILGSPTDPDCNVLHNCVGYACGRFHEIAGDTKFSLIDPINAENMYANGIQHGLKTSQNPQLGAIIVWQAGPTLSYKDGAGHVAIVEQINADGSIVTSESGYDCPTAFWTTTRKKGSDGNWGAGSGYMFLGFVLQPNGPEPEPFKPYTKRLPFGTKIFRIDDNKVEQVSMISVESIYTIVQETTIGSLKYGKLKSGVGWVLLTEDVKELKRGDYGDDVKWLQQQLIAKGYLTKGEDDGDFGKKTMSAVLGFQWDQKLKLTSTCNLETREALMK